VQGGRREIPPLGRLPAYPVTGGIGLLATVVTLLTASGKWDLARFEMSPRAFSGEPWRLVVSALPHVLDFSRMDILHLPMNLYWLWVFGTLIEDVFGHVKTLALVLLLAAGSAAAEYALFRGGIGLSGVGYGLFALLWVLAPRDPRFAGGVDARTTRLMVAWFFFCIVATATKVWAVANVAHGVGALLGALIGLILVARRPVGRVAAFLFTLAILALSWLGSTRLRPKVNLAHDVRGSFLLGLHAIQSGRFDEAIAHYKLAVATDPRSAASWYNLGIAYESSHRDDEALDAYKHAYEVDPHDTRHRSVYVSTSRRVGFLHAQKGDHRAAIEHLLVATDMDPDDPLSWLMLASSYDALGDAEKARKARERAASVKAEE
jgi:membrane associated rhomboid family serine protease